MGKDLIHSFLNKVEREQLEARINDIERQIVSDRINLSFYEIEKGDNIFLKSFFTPLLFFRQLEEVTLTILEKAGFNAFQNYVNMQLASYNGSSATVEEAYNYLIHLRPERSRMFLSIINNGSILYEFLQQQDYNGFLSTLSRAEKGVSVFLCFIYLMAHENDTNIYLIKCLTDEFDKFNEHDLAIIKQIFTTDRVEEILFDEWGRRSLFDVFENFNDEIKSKTLSILDNNHLDKLINDFAVENITTEQLDNYLEYFKYHLWDSIEQSFSKLNHSIVTLIEDRADYFKYVENKILNTILQRPIHDFCYVNHEYYYNFTNDIAINIICDKRCRHIAIPIFFKSLVTENLSIEKDVICRNDENHIIVSKAKEYLESQKQIEIKRSKGRPKRLWLKIETRYSEDEIGQMLKDKVWQELKDRISLFKTIEPGKVPGKEKELSGDKSDIIVDALACCFIYYSANALGYADNLEESPTLSSFVRTTNVLTRVSRNTIKKYWWILKEAEGWEDQRPGYKAAFMKSHTALAMILERNLQVIIETMDFVKIKLDGFWKELENQ